MRLLACILSLCAIAAAVPTWAPGGNGGPWSQGNGNAWGQGQPPWKCTNENKQIRQDFAKMAPADRKAYTDAINCLRDQPSSLDQEKYSGAINRFFDYAMIHINRTQQAHISGYFLTWHRMYLHLFEQDLKNLCGYQGTLPYWNWPATAYDLQNSPVFNGDEYSMSGDGEFTNDDPIVLAPTFSIPHGTGGGCIKSGPFYGMNSTVQDIPITLLLQGGELPPTAFTKNETCLTRDLNSFIAQTQTNWTLFNNALAAPSQAEFTLLLNGVLGGSTLGLHSGAHFTLGSPASSIFVSAQDPVWYPLHTFLDCMYVQWQKAHPEIYDQIYGTMTANNVPPSANVTLDSWEPDWGYLHPSMQVQDLISTTAGPFCYDYDFEPGPYTE
jgi:tyrosinase